jgi:hypothetical protein
LHKKIAIVGHLMGNDVGTLHEERKHLVGFSFLRVYIDIDIDYLIVIEPTKL